MTTKKDSVIAAPIVGGILAVLTYLVFYEFTGFSSMGGSVLGLGIGRLISLLAGVVIGGAVFGQLLADAFNIKK